MNNTTTTITQTMTTEQIPTALLSDDKVPHFVDFSTFLLDSLKTNNSAIQFSYLNSKSTIPKSRNFSIISFILPHDADVKSGNKFFDFLRLPWSPRPQSEISKFPPFMEVLIQRIQQYFSVYKYQDTSQPLFPYAVVYPEPSLADEAIPITVAIQNDFMETTTEIYNDIKDITTTTDTMLDFITESNEI